ncbi:MAG TPA: dual specificity protein phosphatase family protein [Terriglobia bacterium]|nr:dual specificity protein phosphatase family protein [Terriglobia bacterium]
MIDYNRIQPQLLVGTSPESQQEVEALRRDEGVTAVMNLQTDGDLRTVRFFAEPLEKLYAGSSVEIRRVPVRDFDELHLQERLPACVAALHQLLEKGHTVYLHCTAGVNRSPTVAVAYLHWCLGWELESAVEHVESCRPCSPKVQAIRQASWKPPQPQQEARQSSALDAP